MAIEREHNLLPKASDKPEPTANSGVTTPVAWADFSPKPAKQRSNARSAAWSFAFTGFDPIFRVSVGRSGKLTVSWLKKQPQKKKGGT